MRGDGSAPGAGLTGRHTPDDPLPDLGAPELFAEVADQAAVGMCLTSPESRILWANDAMCRFLGLEAAELPGMSVSEITHPDDIASSQAMAARLTAGEASVRSLKRYLRKGGDIRWGDITVSALRTGSGEIRLYVAQIVDATEAVQLRQELAESQERYRLLAENASDVVTRTDGDGVIRWVSPSVTDLTGWAPDDVVGRSVAELAHPDDASLVLAKSAELMAGLRVNYRIRVRCADASTRWVGITARPITDDDGVVVGRIAGWRDASKEVSAQQALAASEEHYRLLAENASDVIVKTDVDEIIEWVSPSVTAVLGWQARDLLGRSYYEVLCPDEGDAEQAPAPAQSRTEARVRTSGGDCRWMLDVRNPLQGSRSGGAIHSLRDVQNEHEAREELQFLAYHDSLTRLATRGVAEERLEQLLTNGDRAGPWIAVLFVDIDGLKAINDRHGHAAGDYAINVVAQRLVRHARAEDLIARFGGDEFVVILPAVHASSDAMNIAERMRRDASVAIALEGNSLLTGVSVGLALAHPGKDAPADTLRRADAALYRAKRSGRNCTVLDGKY